MAEELRLRLRGKEVLFPGGELFCLVCGARPSGTRRVWFEETSRGTLRALARRLEFEAPLCRRHRLRVLRTGLGAVGLLLLAGAILAAGGFLIGGDPVRRKTLVQMVAEWVLLALASVPAFFGLSLWARKDCGGLTCSARREGEDLVLTYDGRAPRRNPGEDPW